MASICLRWLPSVIVQFCDQTKILKHFRFSVNFIIIGRNTSSINVVNLLLTSKLMELNSEIDINA